MEETLNLGKEFAICTKSPKIIFLIGDLGSGKTTFSKGFISEKTKEPLNQITSPTFNYVNVYGQGLTQVAHFDLYRLKSKDEFYQLGLEEIMLNTPYSLIEWPEIIGYTSSNALTLKFSTIEQQRKIDLIGGSFE